MTEPSPPELTGQRLGHFQVDALIGRGGMSTLYRATDTRLGRRVALKVIDPVLAADAEFRERFHEEARNTSAIDHAHVVPLYDFDETDGHLYIAMRFVEGPDLATLVGGRPIAPNRAVALLDQVADALDAVHARGLVHLDVKPANVLVTTRESAGGEHVYLADFGLTRRGATGHRTAGGDFLGSPTYASPEHLRGEPVDARTDLYSLTCVLFTCLTGRAPYLGSVDEVIQAHHAGRVPSASALVGGGPVGSALDDVVRRGMAHDPARRHGSARELIGSARAALVARAGSVTTPPAGGPGPRAASVAGPATGSVAAGSSGPHGSLPATPGSVGAGASGPHGSGPHGSGPHGSGPHGSGPHGPAPSGSFPAAPGSAAVGASGSHGPTPSRPFPAAPGASSPPGSSGPSSPNGSPRGRGAPAPLSSRPPTSPPVAPHRTVGPSQPSDIGAFGRTRSGTLPRVAVAGAAAGIVLVVVLLVILLS